MAQPGSTTITEGEGRKHPDGTTRRDFLYLSTGAFAATGAALTGWAFIHSMNPAADVLALASIEVDVAQLQPGMSLTVKWRGKPVFIRNRTPEEIEAAKSVPLADLKDPVARNANLPGDAPATDADRAAGEGKENWLVIIGVCTHLGCVPLGQSGDFGGWFCPCHGSHYDTAGRVRKGPAPQNMAVPTFAFLSDTKIRIG